jgi:hypothetical protein
MKAERDIFIIMQLIQVFSVQSLTLRFFLNADPGGRGQLCRPVQEQDTLPPLLLWQH